MDRESSAEKTTQNDVDADDGGGWAAWGAWGKNLLSSVKEKVRHANVLMKHHNSPHILFLTTSRKYELQLILS